MVKILVFLTLAVFSASATGGLLDWKGALKVRFGVGFESFFDIPMSKSEAIEQGWSKTPRPDDGLLKILVLYCYDNKLVCSLYDDTGYIAGLQIAFPAANFTKAVFDWETQGYTKWTLGDGQVYWSITQFFITEEYLALNKEDRLTSRDPNKILQLGGVWVTGFNKQLLKISANADDVANSGIFKKQGCIPFMGRHYFYNMTENLPCNSKTIYPWFSLVHSGQLVATGLITAGQLAKDPKRDWFERPNKVAVKMIIPRGPDCVYKLTEDPGAISMHVYYIDKPILLNCIFQ